MINRNWLPRPSYKKYPKFWANSPESLVVLADMKDCFLKQGNRESDYALAPRILNPKRDKDESLSDNNPKLSLYQQQYDTTIPAATCTFTATAAAAAAAAAITNSTTPIAAAAGSLSNTTVREGDDSGSMLSDKNVEEAEIKKKAPISTVLQSCKVSSSGPKSLSNKCLHNKYLKPVLKRKKSISESKRYIVKERETYNYNNWSNKEIGKKEIISPQI